MCQKKHQCGDFSGTYRTDDLSQGVPRGLLEKLKYEKFFLGGGVGVLRGARYIYGVRGWFEKKSKNWLVGQVYILGAGKRGDGELGRVVG